MTVAMDQADVDELDGIAVIAMAGSRVHVSADWIQTPLRKIGVHGKVALESDLLATFCSGAWEPDGYALVAGTGAAAIRVRSGRPDGASDGLGWLLGDDGSGFWLGSRVVRAASAELDGRGPATRLTPLLLESLGIPHDTTVVDREDGRPEALRMLVDAVYALRPIELAGFAPLVFAAPDDAVADRLATDARAELAATLASIHEPAVRGPVVCGGGVLSVLLAGASAGADPLGTAELDGFTELRGVGDGAAGAAVLALRDNGIDVDREAFDRVRDTLAALR